MAEKIIPQGFTEWWTSKKPTALFLLGLVLASFLSYQIYSWRMDEATKQGSIIYKNVVYDVTVRVQ